MDTQMSNGTKRLYSENETLSRNCKFLSLALISSLFPAFVSLSSLISTELTILYIFRA